MSLTATERSRRVKDCVDSVFKMIRALTTERIAQIIVVAGKKQKLQLVKEFNGHMCRKDPDQIQRILNRISHLLKEIGQEIEGSIQKISIQRGQPLTIKTSGGEITL